MYNLTWQPNLGWNIIVVDKPLEDFQFWSRPFDSKDPQRSKRLTVIYDEDLSEDDCRAHNRLSQIPHQHRGSELLPWIEEKYLQGVHGQNTSLTGDERRLPSMEACYVTSPRRYSYKIPVCERHKVGDDECFLTDRGSNLADDEFFPSYWKNYFDRRPKSASIVDSKGRAPVENRQCKIGRLYRPLVKRFVDPDLVTIEEEDSEPTKFKRRRRKWRHPHTAYYNALAYKKFICERNLRNKR